MKTTRKMSLPDFVLAISTLVCLQCAQGMLLPLAASDESPGGQNSPNGEDLVLKVRTSHEGTVNRMPTLITRISIKGEAARIETSVEDIPGPLKLEDSPGPPGMADMSVINFGDTGEMLVISHRTKTYHRVTRQMQEMMRQKAMATMQRAGGLPTERPSLTATGETMEIDGRTAKEYRASNDSQDLRYWLVDSEEFRSLAERAAEAMANPTSSVFTMRFPDLSGYPVRTEIAMELPTGDEVVSVVTLEDYEWTTLPPELFKPPEEYAEVEAPVPPAIQGE